MGQRKEEKKWQQALISVSFHKLETKNTLRLRNKTINATEREVQLNLDVVDMADK